MKTFYQYLLSEVTPSSPSPSPAPGSSPGPSKPSSSAPGASPIPSGPPVGLGGPPIGGLGGPSPSIGGPPMGGDPMSDPSANTQGNSINVKRSKSIDVWDSLKDSISSKKKSRQEK